MMLDSPEEIIQTTFTKKKKEKQPKQPKFQLQWSRKTKSRGPKDFSPIYENVQVEIENPVSARTPSPPYTTTPEDRSRELLNRSPYKVGFPLKLIL